ncbi:uncharacterized protein LOC120228098 [Hyaena hyaena]|uniref:uncharacterized protein LOC120228098 n=1 Tax=Hyaena hyaena TaxID=95912 RepID=UPI00192311B3|nr:uncharacterized protein LOC120228098 [Hyaena hyaena]
MRASALRGPRAALAGSGASRARSEKVTQRCARGSRNSVKLRRWGRSWNTLTLSQRRGRRLVLDLRAPHPHSPGIRREEGRAALPPQCRGHATRGRERRRRLSAGARGPEPPPPAPPPRSSRLAQARAEVWIRRLGKSGAPGGVPEISALEGGGSGEGRGQLPPRPHQPCRAAALNLGVWRETEAQGREDVAVPESVNSPISIPGPRDRPGQEQDACGPLTIGGTQTLRGEGSCPSCQASSQQS